jgi:DNA-directed RNA polymerase subunit N (RpoN/RPB10)
MNEEDIICSSCNKNITEEEKEYMNLYKTYSYNWITNCDYDKPVGERLTKIYSCKDCFSVGNWLAQKNEEYKNIKGE